MELIIYNNIVIVIVILIILLLPASENGTVLSDIVTYMCGKKYTALNLLILYINYINLGVVQGKILWFIEII
jgi:hypothetical protein